MPASDGSAAPHAVPISLHWRWADGRNGRPFDARSLTDAEHEAANRFRRAEDAALWRESRFLMRVVLADRIGVLPLSLRFESGPHGKPMLQGAGRERWRFNLAHSRQLAVLAVSDDPAVDLGIDLEWLHRRVSSDLIRGATAAEERAFLVNLPPASRAAWFLRLWTQKESVLKADGAGLSVPPAEVVFDMPHARLRRLPSRLGSAEAFAVHDVSAPPGHVATLTVRDRWRRPIAVRSATE